MAERTDHDRFFLISMDRIDDTQRGQVQAQIQEHAISWWHQQQNVWIAQGGANSAFWRDLLMGFVTGVPGDLIVLNLPSKGNRSWASFANDDITEWFESTYTNDAALPLNTDSGTA